MNFYSISLSARARNPRRRRGVALLEFALIATLFLGLLMGTLQFGVYLNTSNTLWSLSREGARFAANQRSDDPNADQNILDHISKPAPDGVLPPNIDPSKLTITVTPTDSNARTVGTPVMVVVKYDMSRQIFLPIGNLLPKQYQATTSMMVQNGDNPSKLWPTPVPQPTTATQPTVVPQPTAAPQPTPTSQGPSST